MRINILIVSLLGVMILSACLCIEFHFNYDMFYYLSSANILLDCNLEPKLGDFGLAREGPMTPHTSMKVSGYGRLFVIK